MNCPKCGRTLSQGEICPCQQLDVYKRQMELENEQALEEENQELQYEKNRKKKTKKIKEVSEKSNNVTNKISQFFNDMIFNIKNFDDIEDNYISEENKNYAITLSILNIIFTTLLIYLLLSKSVLSLIFTYFSVFSSISKGALFFASFAITIIPIVAINLLSSFLTKENQIFNITASYIFTIPMTFIYIILTALSPSLGVIFLPVILNFKIIWTYEFLSNYEEKKSRIFLFASIFLLIYSIIIFTILKLIS